MWLVHSTRRELSRADCTAGNSSDARRLMTPSETINSTTVNPLLAETIRCREYNEILPDEEAQLERAPNEPNRKQGATIEM